MDLGSFPQKVDVINIYIQRRDPSTSLHCASNMSIFDGTQSCLESSWPNRCSSTSPVGGCWLDFNSTFGDGLDLTPIKSLTFINVNWWLMRLPDGLRLDTFCLVSLLCRLRATWASTRSALVRQSQFMILPLLKRHCWLGSLCRRPTSRPTSSPSHAPASWGTLLHSNLQSNPSERLP